MSTIAEAAAAQAAAIATSRNNPQRRKMVMGINVAPYAGFRVPGVDRTLIFPRPDLILKNPVPGAEYTWRNPDDGITKSMCNRGVLIPITADLVDPDSRHANYELKKVLTNVGPRQVVRTPGGLGLFRIQDPDKMNSENLGDLPGSHWEKSYLSDLAGEADKFAEDVEQLSSTSVGARITGELTRKDERREPVTG